VIGRSETGASEYMGSKLKGKGGGRGNDVLKYNITAPATPEAKQWQGWGSALKPAVECFTLARKPLSEKNIAENVLRWNTGGINIDGCRVATGDQGERNHGGKVYDNVAEGYQRPNKSSYTHKTDWAMKPQGRFPANLIHDGSDEVLALFPETKSGARKGGDEYKLGRFEGQKGAYGLKKGKACKASQGSAARFFYCAKASKAERNQGLEGFDFRNVSHDGRNKHIENPYQRHDNIQQNNHPTVKPVKLMEYLCKLITPPGGTVLDPYMGSGTTGIACRNLDFKFIGIEIDKEYFQIAKYRISEPGFHEADEEINEETAVEGNKPPRQMSLFDFN